MSNSKIILEGCIKTFKENNEIELGESDVFELFTLTQILKEKNITFENIENSIVDGGNDGGIDSILILVNGEIVESFDELENCQFSNKTVTEIIITQCKKENSFKELTVDKLITTIPIILDLQKDEQVLINRFNGALVDKVLTLREIWQKTVIAGGSIYCKFNYCANAIFVEVNNVFEEKIKQLKNLTSTYISVKNSVDFEMYSCTELLELYQKQKSNRLILEFKDRPLIIDYNDDIGYIGTVKLDVYKEFLTSDEGNIREDLFESNIRHFQGLVDVNKKIKETIEQITEEDFWWLNNGITIIAEEPTEIGRKLSLENVQIVNGLQTSYSIFNNHELLNEERSVLVKIIINKNKDIVDNIIASTNRQNAVSATLLRATEPIQRELELFFSNEGYFYDRRKNYYKNQGKPALRIFGIQFTAQAIESIIHNNPHSARSTPTSLLKNDSTYNRIFDPKKHFKVYLNSCLISKKAHMFLLNIKELEVKNRTVNFKLHFASLTLKVLYELKFVPLNELENFKIDELTDKVLNDTLKLLDDSILKYLEEYKGTNLINIAKSKDFTDFLFKSFS
ncbi:AIPR family protein [Myroides odoratus]|uniref:AIPR protein n=1 Tax=Myroides odoratus TaxID=256 RepID=A0A378RIS3_MYROD|nr:AIPR family protein [Myroides odoratus]QQU02170.1 AIPR family protein [Myroides odoratus]STZ26922.1 AIPR protein [Myroides odoratus]